MFNPSEDPDEFCFSPLSNTATKLAYWDKEAYVSEMVVSTGSPKLAASSTQSQAKRAADLAAAAAEGEGLVPPGKESEIKAKKRKVEVTTAAAKSKKVLIAHSLSMRSYVDKAPDYTGTSPILEQPSR